MARGSRSCGKTLTLICWRNIDHTPYYKKRYVPKDYIRDHGIDFKWVIQRYSDNATWPGTPITKRC